jgi:hypothetical protein
MLAGSSVTWAYTAFCLDAQVIGIDHLAMETVTHQEKRMKPRVSVTLKAALSFAGHEGEEYQVLISNLSATGARLHFERSAPLKAGSAVFLKIYIPGTVLHLAMEGEIFWVRRQHDAVSLGINFKEELSEFMMGRLIEK